MNRIILFSLMCLTLSGCLLEPESGTESGTTVVTEPTATPLPAAPLTDPEQTVCDPFRTNSPQGRDQGLIGSLLFLNDDQPRYGRVSDYIDNAFVAPQTIYLDRLFIPTRPFDRGFYTQTGDLITNDSGTTLYEWFGLRMVSQLKLAPTESPGNYQLALLADDGALMKIPDPITGLDMVIVDDDGTHSTKFACATQPVYLDQNSRIPMSVEYYQGPRFHISLVAMWRPWPDGVTNMDPVNDVLCGQQGNSLFFDSTQDPVVPQTAYYELLARGWKPLENANYHFPDQANNPCVPSEATLAISNFTISAIGRDRVTLNWTTNIASTSQGESKNVSTGVVSLTAVNSTMVQNHTLIITGLSPFTLYSVKAKSSSAGGQNAISDERAFRTLR